MRYRIDPHLCVGDELVRIAVETLDEAIRLLDGLAGADVDGSIDRVHRTRKRCKETRGLVRLARRAIGDEEYAEVDALVRDAARELSALRDTQVVMATVARLIDHAHDDDRAVLEELSAEVGHAGVAASRIDAADPRVRSARKLLKKARKRARRWEPGNDVAPLVEGVVRTHRQGAKALGRLLSEGDDEHSHEWRKRVKHLWYQTRLLQASAPPMLDPVIALADDCAESLGDDHDLAVLIELLDDPDGPRRHLGDASSDRAAAAARRRQDELRDHALRLGRMLYAESSPSLGQRLGAYWALAVADAAEVGADAGEAGDVDVAVSDGALSDAAAEPEPEPETGTSTIERERKFLVDSDTVVESVGEGVTLEQGYVALDGATSVRVRRIGGIEGVLTLKAGTGATRTEVEWAVDDAQFAALWPLTEGRRLVKTRHHVAVGTFDATLDVFGEELEGLRLVEVEFDDEPTMTAFVPPPWFGHEVTDDGRYTNAALAADGRPSIA
ncbi:MAG: CHAD domain-containing protein [Acidimicrobiales bacterium]